ncbi:MAG: hypothetical protein ACRDOO_19245 [Actinomadura sp.]
MRLQLAVLAALVLPLSSCGGSGSESPSGTTAVAPLTKAQAQEILSSYQTTNNRANMALDAKLLASAETGAQLDMDTAGYKLRRATGQKFVEFTYSKPVFYIPRPAGFPRWFAVDAVSSGQRPKQRSGQGSGQREVPPMVQQHRHALLFVQDKAGAPWRLAADPYPTNRSLGGIAVDAAGYATAVAPNDARLALAPTKVGAAHAALLTKGPKAAGTTGIGAGLHTTQSYAALRKATGQFTRIGIGLTSQFAPSTAPVFALRTTDGGALVWYVLRQNETYASRKPGTVSITGDLVGLAPPGKVQKQLDTTVLIQYLSKIPPKGKGAVEVIGTYRKAVQAAAS